MRARVAAATLVALVALAGCADDDAPPACGEGGADSLAACVDADRYAADLAFVTGERTPGSPHWQEVQDRCAATLAELGFTVERYAYGTGVDVIGTRPGTAPAGDDVVLGAHYDHIAGCPGADDNGTGLAAVLEVARALVRTSTPRTLVVACWDEEERGLVGSRHHADRARGAGEGISIAWSLDGIGFTNRAPDTQRFPDGASALFPAQYDWLALHEFRADFIGLAGDVNAHAGVAAFEAAAAARALPTLTLEIDEGLRDNPLVGDLRRSDHASFWADDYPAVVISDSADLRNPSYHCLDGDDTVDTLDLPFAVEVVRTTAVALGVALGLAPS